MDKTSTAEMKNERRKIKARNKHAILLHEHGGELNGIPNWKSGFKARSTSTVKKGCNVEA